MTTASASVLAIDIGGTKVAASIIDDSGSTAWEQRWPVIDADEAPDRFLRNVVEQALASDHTIDAVGVAIPAVLEAETDVVTWAPNLPAWNGLDIRSAIQQAADVPVAVEYDGHASAIGESWVGAGQGIPDFVVVAVGTGIGCGIVSNGHVIRGADRLAGAAGWMITGDGGATWESQASSELASQLASGAADAHVGSPSRPDPHPSYLFEAARAGDRAALDAIAQLGRAIGIGVANLVSVLNPSRVILTGGLGAQAEIIDPVRAAVTELAQPTAGASVEIITSPLGSSSVLLGAARSALCATDSDPKANPA